MDENFVLHQCADAGIIKCKDTFEHDYFGRGDNVYLLQALVRDEAVAWKGGFLAFQQVAQNVVGLVEVQGLRVIEVVLFHVDLRLVNR